MSFTAPLDSGNEALEHAQAAYNSFFMSADAPACKLKWGSVRSFSLPAFTNQLSTLSCWLKLQLVKTYWSVFAQKFNQKLFSCPRVVLSLTVKFEASSSVALAALSCLALLHVSDRSSLLFNIFIFSTKSGSIKAKTCASRRARIENMTHCRLVGFKRHVIFFDNPARCAPKRWLSSEVGVIY